MLLIVFGSEDASLNHFGAVIEYDMCQIVNDDNVKVEVNSVYVQAILMISDTYCFIIYFNFVKCSFLQYYTLDLYFFCVLLYLFCCQLGLRIQLLFIIWTIFSVAIWMKMWLRAK